jgi:hypothetical protein
VKVAVVMPQYAASAEWLRERQNRVLVQTTLCMHVVVNDGEAEGQDGGQEGRDVTRYVESVSP